MFAEEEIAVEDRHGLMLVERWPTSSRVPVIQSSFGREHELPAPGYSIGELEVLPERVAVQPLVEAQRVEHLAAVGHVAPGKALDLHPRAG